MNIIKKIFFVFILAITPSLYSLSGALPGGPGDPLFQMPSPEEMQAIEEFLSTLTPEEIDQLAKIGEDMMQQAAAEGRPLFEGMPLPESMPAPQPKPSSPAQEPIVEEKPQTEIQQKTAATIQSSIALLLRSIRDIQQKSAIDEPYFLILRPIYSDLDLFVYYLHVIQDNKYLNIIIEDDFTALKNELMRLAPQLERHAQQLIIPAVFSPTHLSKKERDQRRRAKQQAEQVLHACLQTLQESFSQKNVIKECEKLLKKYEPQALKLKEESQKKSQLAGTQSSKQPITNTGRFAQNPSINVKYSGSSNPTSHRAKSTGVTIPSSYENDRQMKPLNNHQAPQKGSPKSGTSQKKGSSSSPSGSSGSGALDNAGSENKPDKASEEATKHRTTIKEKQNEMTDFIKKASNLTRQKNGILNNFINSYMLSEGRDTDTEKAVHEALQDINHYLLKAQKAYEDTIKAADKLPDSARAVRNTRLESQQNLNRHSNPIVEFYNTIQKIKELDFDDEKYEMFNADLENFEKAVHKLPFEADHSTKTKKKWVKGAAKKREYENKKEHQEANKQKNSSQPVIKTIQPETEQPINIAPEIGIQTDFLSELPVRQEPRVTTEEQGTQTLPEDFLE